MPVTRVPERPEIQGFDQLWFEIACLKTPAAAGAPTRRPNGEPANGRGPSLL